MTFEYKGAHPQPHRHDEGRRNEILPDVEEGTEDTPIVAEMRVALEKEDAEDALPEEET